MSAGTCSVSQTRSEFGGTRATRELSVVYLNLFRQETSMAIGYLFKNLENDNKMFAITQDE